MIDKVEYRSPDNGLHGLCDAPKSPRNFPLICHFVRWVRPRLGVDRRFPGQRVVVKMAGRRELFIAHYQLTVREFADVSLRTIATV
jgi:hypothetical protein